MVVDLAKIERLEKELREALWILNRPTFFAAGRKAIRRCNGYRSSRW
jgi:hypothetical protein